MPEAVGVVTDLSHELIFDYRFLVFTLQTEFPVPEQFKTVWNGQKLVTTVTEIAG